MSCGRQPSSSSFSTCGVRLPVMRLPTKPSQLPTSTGSLPMRLPNSVAVAIAGQEDFAPRTFSSSRITLAGEKKCIPTTSSGRDVARGDLVDRQGRGVGRQHHARPRRLVEPREDLLLHLHVLEHGLDHEVGLADRALEIGAAGQQSARRFSYSACDKPPRGDRPLPIRVAAREALLQRLLARLHDRHRHAEIGGRHGDAAAHGAAADDHQPLHRQRLRIGRHAGDAQHLALAEEDVAQRLGLLARHQGREQLALLLEPLLEGHGEGRAHGLRAALRAFLPARALEQPGEPPRRRPRILPDDLVRAVAREREGLADVRPRPGDGAGLQVALEHRIDEAELHAPRSP
jgi:hypothetical protein